MARKIAFVIPACVLGLLVVIRVGGTPGKIGTGGAVAWAQDSTPADDTTQNDSSGDVVQPEFKRKLPPRDVVPLISPVLGCGLSSDVVAVNDNDRMCCNFGRGGW